MAQGHWHQLTSRIAGFPWRLKIFPEFAEMLANIAPTARRSAAVTAAVAVVTVALSAAFAGHKGLLGAALAVVVVAAFFGITVLALARAAKVSPQAMMLAGIGTYTFKILVLIILVSTLPEQHGVQRVDVRPVGHRPGPRLRRDAGGDVERSRRCSMSSRTENDDPWLELGSRTADCGPRRRLPATRRGWPHGMMAIQARRQLGVPGQEPPQPPQPRESDGWQILSYMLGGMILYGAIGWLWPDWTGISVLFPLGMILGIGLSIAMIIFRFTRS